MAFAAIGSVYSFFLLLGLDKDSRRFRDKYIHVLFWKFLIPTSFMDIELDIQHSNQLIFYVLIYHSFSSVG